MIRSELLNTLKCVSPALRTDKYAAVLSQLRFDGKYVTAYDNVVALRTPCDLPLEGGIVGDLLLSMLSSSNAAEVTCIIKDSEATFKLGRTRLKLAVLPTSEFLFKPPELVGTKLPLDDKLLTAMKLVARSGTAGLDVVGRSGMTLSFSKRQLTLYATDDVTIVRASIPAKAAALSGKSLILSERFYSLLLKQSGMDSLCFTDSGDVLASSESVELFGRVLDGADPVQFEKVFDSMKLKDVPKVDVPLGLARCLQRALVLSKDMTTFSYADGRLSLHTVGFGGEVRDSVKANFGSKPIEVCTCAESLLRYLDGAERIGLSDRCMVVEGPGFEALVAVRKKK